MKDIAVYVHIPFCTVRCGYCDFNAYAGLDRLKAAYGRALLAEAASWGPFLGARRVTSLAFGGGTPGEVPASDIAAVIGQVRREAGAFADEAEVSLEANPGTTGAQQLAQLRAAGVNRVSFGVQSFDAANLTFLDRIHSPEAAAACLPLARTAGIENAGVDLIYGLPGQTRAAWAADLRRAVSLHPSHISCYALTVEEGTPLARRVARGEATPLDPDRAATMYEDAHDALAQAGYVHYEISNWALPAYESRHNRVYWTGGDYLGLGAGAHGFVDGVRYENVAHPRAYVARAEGPPGPSAVAGDRATGALIADSYRPGRAIAMVDWLETHLRLTEGFDAAAFQEAFGVGLALVAGEVLAACMEASVLDCSEGRVRLTRRGWLLHGEVSARLLAHLS